MKHVQVIDGADNCSYSVCLISDDDFAVVFGAPGQDVEFIEDLTARVGAAEAARIVHRSTTRRILKRDANGTHGTLFFNLIGRRRLYPNRREADVDGHLLDWAKASARPSTAG